MKIDSTNREYSEPEVKSYINGLLKRIADLEEANSKLTSKLQDVLQKSGEV